MAWSDFLKAHGEKWEPQICSLWVFTMLTVDYNIIDLYALMFTEFSELGDRCSLFI